GQTQRVDLTQSVVANKIANWEIASLNDKSGLGLISGQTATAFSYLAQNAGVAQIDYGVQGGGLAANSTVAIAINDLISGNHSPQAQDALLTTANDQIVSIDLSGKMSDVDGDQLTTKLYANPRFTLNGTQVTFTPDGFIGVDHAIYSVEDGKGGYALASIVVISKDAAPSTPNKAPTAKGEIFALDAATTTTLNFDLVKQQLINDEDGDALTIEHIFTVNNRAAKQGATGITYTPGTFRGIDHFTYVISDGKGGYAMNAVTVTVNDSTLVNNKPNAAPVTAEMQHNDLPITISVNDVVDDPDGDTLSVLKTAGEQGQVSYQKNSLDLVYEPNGFVGTDRFVYIVSDKKGGYAMSEVTIDVTDTPPAAKIVQENTLLDTPITIDLSDHISDKETQITDLKISNITLATSPATATLSGQTVTYIPNGFIGNDILTYTVSDGRYSTDGAIVIAVNEYGAHEIVAEDVDLTTAAGTPISIDLNDKISTTAPTAGALSVTSVAGSTLGDTTISNNTLTYTPKPGVYGNDAFVYTVKDSHTTAHYTQGKITVEITPPPAPQITKLAALRETSGRLKADVTCALCDNKKYQYTWVIDGKTVGSSQTYVPTAADDGLNIRLEVTGQDTYGQIAPTQHVVYFVNKVKAIYSTAGAFAALKEDGTVVTWGSKTAGGNSSTVTADLTNVKTIYSNDFAFAAVKNDNSVVTWGGEENGGNSSAVADKLTHVKTIYNNLAAFAALKENGSVITWGNPRYGASSSNITGLDSAVKAIYSTNSAFAALKEDGSVVTWGDQINGGDSSSVATNLTQVKAIYSNPTLFVALKKDGSGVTWGDPNNLANIGIVTDLTNVENIYSTDAAFAAVKENSPVVAWGDRWGGQSINGTTGIKTISSNQGAFAAIKEDSSSAAWGMERHGGDNSKVADKLTSGVTTITGAAFAFAALKEGGSVVAWGHADFGGVIGLGSTVDPEKIAQLSSGVKAIFTTGWAFAALKNDGSVVAWGSPPHGADTSNVVGINSGVKTIYSNGFAFAALKEDSSVVAWGGDSHGGNTSLVAEELKPTLILIEASLP
ncbi:MAG: Ig-like domain-containing protein, partial [Plesiomonas sp.]